MALAGTLHDPEGRLRAMFASSAAHLAHYAHISVVATAATDRDLVAALRAAGVRVLHNGDERAGENRRQAIADATTLEANSIFSCDFDRWLHWAQAFPDELAALGPRIASNCADAWYVCLGRTPRAYATHPLVQRVAEEATNHPLSLALGRQVDATAGASWLSREGADILLRSSIEPTLATDTEWPLLVHSVDPTRVAYLACEGLEFETADRYGPEIEAAGGLASWTERTYETPEVWHWRLRLAADSSAAICRVLDGPTSSRRSAKTSHT